jgi:hypothetical protein
MLILKLTLVPFFLMLISLIGKRYGPARAGWMAGLPVIVGPILLLMALEHGAPFAARAAHFTLASVFTVITFGVAYSHAARRYGWGGSLLIALVAWLMAAVIVSQLPMSISIVTAIALVTLLLAPYLYPPYVLGEAPSPLPVTELLLRMLLGAVLTYIVTTFATTVGETWSGIAALAPVLTPVLAIFIHRRSGRAHAIALLSNLARGLYSLLIFCFIVAWQLEARGVTPTFLLALVCAIVVQTATYFWRRQSAKPTQANA